MAAPTYDAAYDTLNQELLGGNDWVVAGNLNIDKSAGGKFYLDEVELTASAASLNTRTSGQPATATIAPAAGAANVSNVTITVKDGDGVAVTGPVTMEVLLADAASGAGLTAVTASGAVAAGASGIDLATLVTKKALLVQTTAAGVYILSITDAAKTGFFVVAQIPGIKAVVSAQLVAGNYG